MHKLLLLPFVFFLSIMAKDVVAQAPIEKELRQKTFERLRTIIESSPALTGMVAVDLSNGDTFAFNQNEIFPQASAIKIPILMEVYSQAYKKKIALKDMQPIDPAAVVGGTGVIKDLQGPVSLSIQNLAVLMITLSDNTATNILIDLVGMSEVNKSLQALGLQQTRLQRKMINAAASGRGEENIATPAEAARIMQMLYKGEFLNKATSADIVSILKKTDRRTSRLAPGIPSEVPIAFKPGSLNGVSTEWAIILLPERPYAVAIMESYKIDGQAPQVMEEISETLYQYFWRVGNATRYGTYVDPKMIK
ncbi:serine hydrolase [Pontibacter sp. BT731]|uniref:serine hydrolase n=1 Tax=Pontibacter coccineus TaxID=3063328 RepID=UPI0026E24FFE|nr:serine hydrolase [Pontibacter sp. BT731]MDO6392114.1 serine hydrolase [Pontibacter sp. BT731]